MRRVHLIDSENNQNIVLSISPTATPNSSQTITKAVVHDVQYLNDIKHSRLHHCLLLADKEYLSASQQIDLFEYACIELQTPMRANQTGYSPWPKTFKKARRRVETVFSQLCDQMMLKQNYAKSFTG